MQSKGETLFQLIYYTRNITGRENFTAHEQLGAKRISYVTCRVTVYNIT